MAHPAGAVRLHGRSLRILVLLMAACGFLSTFSSSATFVGGGRQAPLMRGRQHSGLVARSAGAGGTTSLMEAAHLGDVEALQKLLKDGTDINAQDDYGWTALRYAVRSDRYIAAEALVDAGADLNMPSSSGRTPLMSAAANGLDDMVRLLVKSGADLSATNKDGRTAYDLALRGGPTGSDMIREMVKV
mmetsp:Transcript_55864/g.103415  ORF Transcript_55864/g.103415 Transcript_55864/m.103415 type:complete len:188 (-) Transcript_55864:22-585(-)